MVKNGNLTEHMTALLVGSTGYINGNATALHHVIGLTSGQSSKYAGDVALLPDVEQRPRRAGQRSP